MTLIRPLWIATWTACSTARSVGPSGRPMYVPRPRELTDSPPAVRRKCSGTARSPATLRSEKRVVPAPVAAPLQELTVPCGHGRETPCGSPLAARAAGSAPCDRSLASRRPSPQELDRYDRSGVEEGGIVRG